MSAGEGRDLVGIYASGGTYAGFANAFGQKVSKKGGVGGPVALASGYENTYPLPNRPE